LTFAEVLHYVESHTTQVITLVGAIATATGALLTVRKNVRINLRNKRVDVAMHSNSRYDQIYETKMRLRFGAAEESAARSYYARFWGLKSDEFDYWLADLIDIETYCNWSFMTMKAFNDRQPFAPEPQTLDFEWGWSEVGTADHLIPNPWFYELTEAIRELGSIWREIRLASDLDEAREREMLFHLFSEMIDVLDIVHQRSEEYRRNLLDGMTFQDYRKTLKEHPKLGLLLKDRKSRHLEKLKSFLPPIRDA
jgi:hypothetical protein